MPAPPLYGAPQGAGHRKGSDPQQERRWSFRPHHHLAGDTTGGGGGGLQEDAGTQAGSQTSRASCGCVLSHFSLFWCLWGPVSPWSQPRHWHNGVIVSPTQRSGRSWDDRLTPLPFNEPGILAVDL